MKGTKPHEIGFINPQLPSERPAALTPVPQTVILFVSFGILGVSAAVMDARKVLLMRALGQSSAAVGENELSVP